MDNFLTWWERRGWWFARRHNLTEEVVKELWNEVCRYGYRD